MQTCQPLLQSRCNSTRPRQQTHRQFPLCTHFKHRQGTLQHRNQMHLTIRRWPQLPSIRATTQTSQQFTSTLHSSRTKPTRNHHTLSQQKPHQITQVPQPCSTRLSRQLQYKLHHTQRRSLQPPYSSSTLPTQPQRTHTNRKFRQHTLCQKNCQPPKLAVDETCHSVGGSGHFCVQVSPLVIAFTPRGRGVGGGRCYSCNGRVTLCHVQLRPQES